MIVFRADASYKMGSGHVARCLTLAMKLRELGQICHFLSQNLPGNLTETIKQNGFDVSILSPDDNQELEQSASIITKLNPEIIVVDHYGLDIVWERAIRKYSRAALVVIDDLADRAHDCKLLLDQNLGRRADDYINLVSSDCIKLIGTDFALLRPEFLQLRSASLKRRAPALLEEVMISMGGGDNKKLTEDIMNVMANVNLSSLKKITLIAGKLPPDDDLVTSMAKKLNVEVEVTINANNMGELMTRADLAIGAAGTTSWERCCLGLPCLVLTLADNQLSISQALQEAGAITIVGDVRNNDWQDSLKQHLENQLQNSTLTAMSKSAAKICDGDGCGRVAGHILKLVETMP